MVCGPAVSNGVSVCPAEEPGPHRWDHSVLQGPATGGIPGHCHPAACWVHFCHNKGRPEALPGAYLKGSSHPGNNPSKEEKEKKKSTACIVHLTCF